MTQSLVSDAELAADVANRVAPDQAMNQLNGHIAKVWALDDEIAELENKVALLKKDRTAIVERTIPEVMRTAQLTKVRLDDGTEVRLQDEIFGSVPKEKQPGAFKWLEEHGHGDLIKNEIKTNFGRGEDEKATRLAAFIREMGMDYSQSRSVNHMTMKAFLRAQLESGVAIPLDTFGVYMATIAKIKAPSQKG